MTHFADPTTDALVDLPEVPRRRQRGERDRVVAHALAADVARLHGEALLRTARRFSATADDAHDAYQRALELLLEHAATIDRAKAVSWMHVVVRREASVLRKHQERHVPLEDGHFDDEHRRAGSVADEHLHAIDLAQRAGESLATLKEAEAQALCLRAQGMSYEEIGELYGWSYTKVNRAVSEGRKAFVDHYNAVESGVVCGDTAELITRYVAGELKPRVAIKVRAHLVRCSGCRALLHAERGADTALRALLPPVVLLAGEGTRRSGGLGWLHDHLLGPIGNVAARIQPLADHLTGAKLGVVAASTIALAGGGVAVEHHHIAHAAKPALLKTSLVADHSRATTTTQNTVARVVDRAISRGDQLRTQARKQAEAAAARKKKAARLAARKKAAAKARRVGNAKEFTGAASEFTSAAHTTSTTRRSTATRTSAASPSAPETQVDMGGGSDSTVNVQPESAPPSASSSDPVTNEFGN